MFLGLGLIEWLITENFKQEHETAYQSVNNNLLIDQERRPEVKLFDPSYKWLNILS